MESIKSTLFFSNWTVVSVRPLGESKIEVHTSILTDRSQAELVSLEFSSAGFISRIVPPLNAQGQCSGMLDAEHEAYLRGICIGDTIL